MAGQPKPHPAHEVRPAGHEGDQPGKKEWQTGALVRINHAQTWYFHEGRLGHLDARTRQRLFHPRRKSVTITSNIVGVYFAETREFERGVFTSVGWFHCAGPLEMWELIK